MGGSAHLNNQSTMQSNRCVGTPPEAVDSQQRQTEGPLAQLNRKPLYTHHKTTAVAPGAKKTTKMGADHDRSTPHHTVANTQPSRRQTEATQANLTHPNKMKPDSLSGTLCNTNREDNNRLDLTETQQIMQNARTIGRDPEQTESSKQRF